MARKMIPHDALIDTESSALLILSSFPAAITFINSCTPDTHHLFGVQYPNYTTSFDLLEEDETAYPQWSWDRRTRRFSRTNAVALTKELYAKAALARAKLHVTLDVMRQLSLVRRRVGTGIEFQDRVYMAKRLQAETFKRSGYDEADILEYPYVLQYAELAGMPLREAADEIIFKANLSDQHLANTELMRLRYMRAIKAASKPEELTPILEAFRRDMYVNPQI